MNRKMGGGGEGEDIDFSIEEHGAFFLLLS